MSHVCAFILCLLGFAVLAAATDRQQRDLLGRSLPQRVVRTLRVGGIFVLVLAMTVLVVAQDWGLGLVMFSGHTTLAAGITYCSLIASGRYLSGRDGMR